MYKAFEKILDDLPKEQIHSTDIERLYAKRAARIAITQINATISEVIDMVDHPWETTDYDSILDAITSKLESLKTQIEWKQSHKKNSKAP